LVFVTSMLFDSLLDDIVYTPVISVKDFI
jgi:hypothetical protein